MGDDLSSWRRTAACQGVPTGLFFPERGPTQPIWVAAAKAVCSTCPVQRDCLEAAMSEPRGIWGGLTASERRRLRCQIEAEATA